MISIYPAGENIFNNNGIKILKPLKAIIRKEDNGEYYIDLKDTIDNIDYYQSGLIIRVKTPWGHQGFRLKNPNIDKNIITCKGKHLYFDTANYLIEDSYVVNKTCNDALDHLNSACDNETPFSFISDVTTVNSYRCVRKTLEQAINEVIERWGGHLVRDNFNIEIREKIGQDRGVTLRVGKNIASAKTAENWDNVVTKVLPVGKGGITLPEVYLELEETLYDIPYSKIVEFNQDDVKEDNYKDANDNLDEESYKNALIVNLRQQAKEYLEENKLPKVNYSVEAYIKDVSDVGDTIYVKHPKCKIDLITNVIAIEYDCIRERYTKIEFGNFKNRLKDLITTISSKVQNNTTAIVNQSTSQVRAELIAATNRIWGVLGNSYVIDEGDKILVVDKLPKEEATNVMMINSGGIGFSKTGINGTFNSAWTIDGTLNMQNINVINLVADMIKGGTLKLGGKDNGNGIVEIYDKDMNLIGKIDNTGMTLVVESSEISLKELSDTIRLFSIDLENYNLTVSTDSNNIPLETKDFAIKFFSYFKGQQVNATANTADSCEGIDISFTSEAIVLSVSAGKKITNLNNEITINFVYEDENKEIYTLSKKIVISLALQGTDGQKGKDGVDGKDGAPGTPGANGTSAYFYVKYSTNLNGNPMTDTPTDVTEYMGVASTTATSAPTSNTAYTWSKIKGSNGKDGIPGTPGSNGLNTYLHIMYSDDGTMFTEEVRDADGTVIYELGKKPSAWIGQYADNTEADSENFSDYEWYKFTEDIDPKLEEMEADIAESKTDINNNYQDLNNKINNCATAESVVTVSQKVEQILTDNSLTLEIIKNIQFNGVSQVKTKKGYIFNDNGLLIKDSSSPVENLVNQNGIDITNVQNDTTVLFAGYVDKNNTKYAAYKGQTLLGADHAVVNTISVGSYSRFGDYVDEDGNCGTGPFEM